MAKANKKDRDLTTVNKHFDIIENSLNGLIDSSEQIMPLFSDSLKLSRKILKMYKVAFNRGIELGKRA